ncbi:MAG: hypothetical protein ABEN55_11375, partial [Bradymonadaceae bacterium]
MVDRDDVLGPNDVFDWLRDCREAWRGDVEVLWHRAGDASRVGDGPLMLLNRTFHFDGGQSIASPEGSRDQPTALSIAYAHDVRL